LYARSIARVFSEVWRRAQSCDDNLRSLTEQCLFLGIRHPEELSLMRKMDRDELKRNQGVSATRRTQIPGMMSSPNGHAPVNTSYDSGTGTLGSPFRTSTTPQVH
jgi:hypothetical protein